MKTLVRRNATLFPSLPSLFEDFFNRDRADSTMAGQYHSLFNTQVRQGDHSFIVSIPVPGMSRDDLSVRLEGNVLVVESKDHGRLLTPATGWKQKVKHSFVLTDDIDPDHIQAKCRNGLLTIKVKKAGKKRHSIIKVSGQDDHAGGTGRLNSLWDKLKAKMDIRRLQVKQMKMS